MGGGCYQQSRCSEPCEMLQKIKGKASIYSPSGNKRREKEFGMPQSYVHVHVCISSHSSLD